MYNYMRMCLYVILYVRNFYIKYINKYLYILKFLLLMTTYDYFFMTTTFSFSIISQSPKQIIWKRQSLFCQL